MGRVVHFIPLRRVEIVTDFGVWCVRLYHGKRLYWMFRCSSKERANVVAERLYRLERIPGAPDYDSLEERA